MSARLRRWRSRHRPAARWGRRRSTTTSRYNYGRGWELPPVRPVDGSSGCSAFAPTSGNFPAAPHRLVAGSPFAREPGGGHPAPILPQVAQRASSRGRGWRQLENQIRNLEFRVSREGGATGTTGPTAGATSRAIQAQRIEAREKRNSTRAFSFGASSGYKRAALQIQREELTEKWPSRRSCPFTRVRRCARCGAGTLSLRRGGRAVSRFRERDRGQPARPRPSLLHPEAAGTGRDADARVEPLRLSHRARRSLSVWST